VTNKPLEHKDSWQGRYRGVRYKVAHWGVGRESLCNGQGAWNYYLYVPLMGFDDAIRPTLIAPAEQHQMASGPFWTRNYNAIPLGRLDMHYGCTYYRLHCDDGGQPIIVELGCDYNHLWDDERGYGYTLEEVAQDATRSIDALWEMYPQMRVRSEVTGKYLSLAEAEAEDAEQEARHKKYLAEQGGGA
jgi:hypothetical protein